MKAVFVAGKGRVEVRELPVPKPKAGELLVRMRACGICGSDLEKVYGEYGMGSVQLGHELAGEVAAVGLGVNGFVPGDRVFVRQRVPCYSGRLCAAGNHTTCDLFRSTGVEPCGLAEQFIVPDVNVRNGGVIPLPGGLPFEEAAACEPLSCCLRAVNRCGLRPSETVAIIGAGPAGLMFAMALKARGAGQLFLLDVNVARLAWAQLVAEAINPLDVNPIEAVRNRTEGGVDLVVVATSSMSIVETALGMLRRGGRLLLFGVPPKDSTLGLDLNHFFSNEIALLTSAYSIRPEVEEALRLVASGQINLRQLITHTFPIGKSPEAFALAREGEGMKIVITA